VDGVHIIPKYGYACMGICGLVSGPSSKRPSGNSLVPSSTNPKNRDVFPRSGRTGPSIQFGGEVTHEYPLTSIKARPVETADASVKSAGTATRSAKFHFFVQIVKAEGPTGNFLCPSRTLSAASYARTIAPCLGHYGGTQ
jgi:hypothetical protein